MNAVAAPLELTPSQKAELDFLGYTPRAFLFSETGVGKTPVLLAHAANSLHEGTSVVWVTEKGLLDQLSREADSWLPHGLPRPRASIRPGDVGFAGVSHHWMARNPGAFEGVRIGLVVVDEADAVGSGGLSPESPTYRSIRALAGRAPRSVMATATPVASTHGLDLQALLEGGNAPGLRSRSDYEQFVRFAEFDNGHGGIMRSPAGLDPAGLDYLRRVVASVAVATRVGDVDADWPRIERRDTDVPLQPSQLRALQEIARASTGLRRHQLSRQATESVEALSKAGAEQVALAMRQGHSHIVAYAETFDLLQALERELHKMRIPTWRFTGRETPKQRSRAIEEQKCSPRGVLMGTSAIETGLNLQHCSALISILPTWSHRREAQREGRIRRTGSRFAEVLHIRVSPDSKMDRRRIKRVDEKRVLHEAIMSAVKRPQEHARAASA